MGLCSANELAVSQNDPGLRICDVRWYLPTSGRSGAQEYAAGHLPGAVFIDLDRDLAAPDDGSTGRHPLPARETFEGAMRRAGIGPQTRVVAYDDAGGAIAARLWWLLRAHGHARVDLLDGGLGAWQRAGHPLTTEVPEIAPGTFVSRWRPEAALSLAEVSDAIRRGGLLLDARGRDRYRGETEPVDPRPGHIPGAVSAPFAESLEDGHFRRPAELTRQWRSLVGDRQEVIASCGSGVTACHTLFVLDWLGIKPLFQAQLYAGSYSEWSRRRELPVALGDEPGRPA